MRSHEVLRAAADKIGVKALASELRLSQALVYKWCQEWDPDDPDASGARNPLDRLAEIVRVTGDKAVVSWLCASAGGFFVPNPRTEARSADAELILTTQRVVTAFSELLEQVSEAIENDGRILPDEAERIRREWEDLKSVGEGFVSACERGLFAGK